jgi:dephospho-CoA kinase
MIVFGINKVFRKNTKARKRFFVCLTGMPGAGKSSVADSLKERGFYVISMGDVVRDEARLQNMELTDTNLGDLMLKLRKEMGPGAISHLIIKKTKCEDNNLSKIVIIDGIRSIHEVEILKDIGNVKLLAIHASTDTRFKHIKQRARSDKPLNEEDFVVRDKRELTVGISEAIALSDESISNNNLTIEELKEKAYEIIQKWISMNDAEQ